MATGISKAKGRQSSKSKRNKTYTGPAKAGRRKVYTSGSRQHKTFNTGYEGFCMEGLVTLGDKRVGGICLARSLRTANGIPYYSRTMTPTERNRLFKEG